MALKASPRTLIIAISLTGIALSFCIGSVGYAICSLVMQRQMTDIVMSAQSREDAHKLEIEKVRLETAADWQKKVDAASTDDAKQQAQIDKLTAQNETLIKSLDRLARSSEQRILAAAKIQNKLDTVASKVDQVSDATPGVRKSTDSINKRIQDTNRSLK